MECLPLPWRHELDLFRRRYLQLQVGVNYPKSQYLRQEAFQKALFNGVFAEGATEFHPPLRYRLHILKELIHRIETSICNWEEDSISEDLVVTLSSLLSVPLPPEAVSVQLRSYVTYTLSCLSAQGSVPRTVTLLEVRSLLSAAGTTGHRTWEASLHLGAFLCSSNCNISLKYKNILELGAGTGFVSICCAKYLGASHVTATDGSGAVISDLGTNFFLNGLQEGDLIEAKQLKWGEALLSGEQIEWNNGRNVDLVLGADVIYDNSVLPALVATMTDLVELFPSVKILMSVPIRNEETFATFMAACQKNGFVVERIDFDVLLPEKQEGPFYGDGTPIRLYIIRKSGN